MRIDVEKWIIHDKNNSIYDMISYKVLNTQYCCDKIKMFPMLDLYYEYCQDSDDMEKLSDEYDRILGVMLQENFLWYDGDDYQADERYHLITHCPRCGDKIEVNIVREVDKTEEYYGLKKQYDDLHNKWRKCDSKKQSAALEQQWREVDKKINNCYITDTIRSDEN